MGLFLQKAIGNMSRAVLQRPQQKLGAGSSFRPCNAVLYDEFYRGCWEMFQKRSLVISQTLGASEHTMFDFFFEPQRWAISITREKGEQERRIAEDPKRWAELLGKYLRDVGRGDRASRDHAVLDFRTTVPPAPAAEGR
jgi:hypothetical protein